MYLKLITVAGLASFGVMAAIPTGYSFELSPWLIFISCVVGGLLGVYVAAFLGSRIHQYLSRFIKLKPVSERKFISRIWNRFGIVGLGLVGTMTVGTYASIALGLAFKAPRSKLVRWCCVGVVTRCAIFTALAHFGLKMF